jgi:hypothetical protein
MSIYRPAMRQYLILLIDRKLDDYSFWDNIEG